MDNRQIVATIETRLFTEDLRDVGTGVGQRGPIYDAAASAQ
jgi:hypothetical protein